MKVKNIKVALIFAAFLFAASFMTIRLYNLQINKGDYYGALAIGQQVGFEEVNGERGGIFFKDGEVPLAKTERKHLVYISPNKISDENLEEALDFASEITNESKESLRNLFKTETIIKREITKENRDKVNAKNMRGIYTDTIWARVYPQKELASHVMGFSNQEGEGQYGVEGYYNDILKGVSQFKSEVRSPFGYLNVITENKKTPEEIKGADIYLTLDYNIQYFAEKLLNEVYDEWKIDSGQIIVSEPKTGKILALASFPRFDPNNYSSKKNLKVFLNPAVQYLYEPGSVFKPITMASAIEENLLEPDTTYVDKGYVEIVGPPIYNFQRRVWGEQSMTDVLEESINTGAVFAEQKLGEDLFMSYLKKFGLFKKTGIDLQGEEYSENEPLKKQNPRDMATASFGQGIQITPMQLIRAFSALINGGNLMKPYIVEKIVKPNGEETNKEPEIQGKVISKNTTSKLGAMLISVVENGAGRRAQINHYYIGGKTGTAQVPIPGGGGYYEDKTIQSFIGFLPALDPELLIFVKLDNPKEVSTAAYSAVPAFRKMAKYIIDYYQIPPSYEGEK